MQTAPGPTGKIETWLSSPTRGAAEQTSLYANKMGMKRVNPCQDPNGKERTPEVINGYFTSGQSPFQTLPSCQDKVIHFEYKKLERQLYCWRQPVSLANGLESSKIDLSYVKIAYSAIRLFLLFQLFFQFDMTKHVREIKLNLL